MTTLATYFRTDSVGGMELRNHEIKNYVTLDKAIEAGKKDTWNVHYRYFKIEVVANENGTVKEVKTEIEEMRNVGGRNW